MISITCSQQANFYLIFYLQDMVDWGDNTTAVTGLSDLAYPPDVMGRWGEDVSGGSGGGSTNTSNSEEDDWKFKYNRSANLYQLFDGQHFEKFYMCKADN